MKALLVVFLVLTCNLVAGNDDFVPVRGALAAAVKEYVQSRQLGGAFTLARQTDVSGDWGSLEPELQRSVTYRVTRRDGKFELVEIANIES